MLEVIESKLVGIRVKEDLERALGVDVNVTRCAINSEGEMLLLVSAYVDNSLRDRMEVLGKDYLSNVYGLSVERLDDASNWRHDNTLILSGRKGI